MHNFKIILFFIISILLSGCGEIKETQREQIKVKIVDINPPKYFKIIVDIPGENKTKTISISKRCSVKDNLKGSETIITKVTSINTKTGEYSYSYEKFLEKSAYCN